jgi:hypothetical protein
VREDFARQGVRNLEAIELGLREAIAKDARRALESLYREADLVVPGAQARPGEKRHAARTKQVETLFGAITLERDYFYDPATGEGRAPLDEALGPVHGPPHVI